MLSQFLNLPVSEAMSITLLSYETANFVGGLYLLELLYFIDKIILI